MTTESENEITSSKTITIPLDLAEDILRQLTLPTNATDIDYGPILESYISDREPASATITKNPEQLSYIFHLETLTPANRNREIEKLMVLFRSSGWIEFDSLEIVE